MNAENDDELFEGEEFDDYQIEQMIKEIGDILVLLQNRKVIDFSKKHSIYLLDSYHTKIEFQKTEEQEVKRFISLVASTSKHLRYVGTHLSKTSELNEVVRSDRLMGSVSYSSTRKLMSKPSASKSAVLWEIERSLGTPENKLFVFVIFSMMFYCEKYLSTNGLLRTEGRLDSPTLSGLKAIRLFSNELLKTPSIRKILVNSIDELSQVKKLFHEMIDRVKKGMIPSYYASIYNLLYKWRYYMWVVSSERDVISQSLSYHFWLPSPMKRAILYQSWVSYVILRKLIKQTDFQMSQSSKDELIFTSTDGRISVAYQRSYQTGLVHDGNIVIDRPDVSLVYDGKPAMILDAKNSAHKPLAYREKMQSYLRSSGARFAIILHSKASLGRWDPAEEKAGRIIWTHLIPPRRGGTEHKYNEENLDKIFELLQH